MEAKGVIMALVAAMAMGCSDAAVDTCLDNGGSFNYDKCECDYSGSHDYKENHSC